MRRLWARKSTSILFLRTLYKKCIPLKELLIVYSLLFCLASGERFSVDQDFFWSNQNSLIKNIDAVLFLTKAIKMNYENFLINLKSNPDQDKASKK